MELPSDLIKMDLPEAMEVETPYDVKITFDGTKIFPLGKDVYAGVQWFNNGLSYIIRVSQVFYINYLLKMICFNRKDIVFFCFCFILMMKRRQVIVEPLSVNECIICLNLRLEICVHDLRVLKKKYAHARL